MGGLRSYFASDIHLRLDRPDRGHRFAAWVRTIDPADPLTIVGDLCDFWYASRQRRDDPMACPGLRALAEYSGRGGTLTILPGNHDTWLGPHFERHLGARVVPNPLELDAFGLRLHLTHGHLVGGRGPLKSLMEGRAFLHAFGAVPGPLARGLETVLDRSNDRNLPASTRKHMNAFRRYASRLDPAIDLAVFGHVHRHPIDDDSGRPRWIVLGDWLHGSSYLTIDAAGARLTVEPGGAGHGE
ncbi:MAG TPA: UDP-2,3-diacylglucosamine diphosphatase [Isosphaeraceae bacterium]|nr:UDP-2,3-diacylglucosamine diphosphatase [Isosphaeraceae bacterium]